MLYRYDELSPVKRDRAKLWLAVSFWDALIVAAAERTKCRYLLSEDFQTGREFGSITVVSPFEASPGISL